MLPTSTASQPSVLPRPAAALTAILIMLIVIAAASGLLFSDRIYQPDAVLRPQFRAQDTVMIAVAVPLLFLCMAGARRGSIAASIVWAGLLLHIAYFYYFYVGGVQFGPLFLVHIAIVSVSLFALLSLVLRTDADRVRRYCEPDLRPGVTAGFLLFVGLAFAGVWIADTIMRLRDGRSLDLVARAVYSADLIVILPAMVATGVGLQRSRPWAFVWAGVLLTNLVAVMITLAVTGVFSRAAGQPVQSGEILPAAAVALAGLAVGRRFPFHVSMPLLRHRPTHAEMQQPAGRGGQQ